MKVIYMRETLLKLGETMENADLEALLASGTLKEAWGLMYLVIEK